MAAVRGTVYSILLLAAGALVVNSVVGESGFVTRMRAGRQRDELRAAVERLRAENARLREEVDLLRSDPETIEEVARRELGLIRPGEKLFIIRDVEKR